MSLAAKITLPSKSHWISKVDDDDDNVIMMSRITHADLVAPLSLLSIPPPTTAPWLFLSASFVLSSPPACKRVEMSGGERE